MSAASNAAPALRRPGLLAGAAGTPAELPQARPAETPACASVLAAAVLDVVADLAGDSSGEAALQARNGAAKMLELRHDELWGLRRAERSGFGAACKSGLEYLGALGRGLLVTPCGVEPGGDGNLWVSCLSGEGLAVLRPDGGAARMAKLPGTRPWGLFQAGGGMLWVCDFARPVLLLVDSEGEVRRELPVEPPAGMDGLRPILGAADPDSGWNVLYLILADGAGRNRRLARLDLRGDARGAGLELLPCPLALPSALRVRGGRLHVSSLNPAAILSRPITAQEGPEEWTRFSGGLVPEYLTQFAFAGEDSWLAAKGRLARLDGEGSLTRVVDAAALSGRPGCNFCGLAALTTPEGPRLFVADNIHDLVHVFGLG